MVEVEGASYHLCLESDHFVAVEDSGLCPCPCFDHAIETVHEELAFDFSLETWIFLVVKLDERAHESEI